MKELYAKEAQPTPIYQEVVIKDIDMKFGSMVWFMVKWAFAAIPALLIIATIIFVFSLGFSMIGFGLKSIGH